MDTRCEHCGRNDTSEWVRIEFRFDSRAAASIVGELEALAGLIRLAIGRRRPEWLHANIKLDVDPTSVSVNGAVLTREL